MKRKDRTGIVFVVVVSLFLMLTFLSSTQQQTSSEVVEPAKTTSLNTATINLPAVDNEGNGVIATLKVQAIPGEGRILTNVDNILFWVDTQYSIRIAEMVAENLTNKDLSDIDLIYTIDTNASLIEGQSAGAAITIATVAVIENKTIPNDVMITGTINLDSTIGPVGSILAKAKASKDVGATTFLVPKGQGTQTTYKPEKTCEKIGPVTFCQTEYKAEKVDISKDAELEVIEVATIQDALPYFIK
ncbi:MAG: hypothetical protein HYT70_00430 [Candidatus Aenigmarchaeota archaeon]|nr:hypothetical protein [Candidatus Aenigmarchaeota archaeon]